MLEKDTLKYVNMRNREERYWWVKRVGEIKTSNRAHILGKLTKENKRQLKELNPSQTVTDIPVKFIMITYEQIEEISTEPSLPVPTHVSHEQDKYILKY